jgi:hypothetical protein
MGYYYRDQNSPVRQGDLLMRPKHSGFGWHYATGLSNGLVKDVTPENGKHITTWEVFCAGKQGIVVRPNRTPLENAIVEQRTLSTVGDVYNAPGDNCEHDASFSQSGVAVSPTANFWGGVGVVGAGLLLFKALVDAKNAKPKRRR